MTTKISKSGKRIISRNNTSISESDKPILLLRYIEKSIRNSLPEEQEKPADITKIIAEDFFILFSPRTTSIPIKWIQGIYDTYTSLIDGWENKNFDEEIDYRKTQRAIGAMLSSIISNKIIPKPNCEFSRFFVFNNYEYLVEYGASMNIFQRNFAIPIAFGNNHLFYKNTKFYNEGYKLTVEGYESLIEKYNELLKEAGIK